MSIKIILMFLLLFLFTHFHVSYFFIIFLILPQRSVEGDGIAKEDQDNDIKKACLVIKCSYVIWVKVKNPIPPTRRPTGRSTRRSTHHRHTTDPSANTLPTRWSTHYRRVL